MRKRTKLDWAVLVVVVAVAALVITSSFQNTAKLAEILGMPPILAAGIVEIAFTTFLFLRGRQRALGLNTPLFLHGLYFGLLALVTGVNMWGLSIENQAWGLIIGASISLLLWGMETTLVWLWTDSHRPHQKSLRERKREARREIQEEKAIQWLAWERDEAKKPDLKLIQKAREKEEERKKVVGDGLPEFFRSEESPQRVVLEPVVQETEPEQTKVVPMIKPMGEIGFRVEPEPAPKSKPLFQPNLEARARAVETARELKAELGRIPKKRELMDHGLSDHYAKFAMKELQK